MSRTMMIFVWLVIAVVAAAFAAGMAFVFARPIVSQQSNGRITAKMYYDEQTITRYNAGPRRQDWSLSQRKIPAGYLLTIDLDDGLGQMHYVLEKNAAEQYQIGQPVIVTYDKRGVAGIWSKRYVRAIAPIPPTNRLPSQPLRDNPSGPMRGHP